MLGQRRRRWAGYLTLLSLNLPSSSSSTTSRELLSQFPTCVVCEDDLKWVQNENVLLLLKLFHAYARSKPLVLRNN